MPTERTFMYSILIIDDEPIVKIALRSILPWEEHGFFICGTASNGLEAVPLIEKHHPDIIITDLKMPGTNSFSEGKRISRRNTGTKQLRRLRFSKKCIAFRCCGLSVKNQNSTRYTPCLSEQNHKKNAKYS